MAIIRKSRAVRSAIVTCCAVVTSTHLLSHLAPSSSEAEQPSGASFAAGVISAHGHRDMKLASADTTWGILPKPVAQRRHTEVNSGMEGTWSAPPLPQFREFVQHILRRLGRLEERWLGPVNFDRANLRISGMDTYSVVASVLMLTLLGLYGATKVNPSYEEAEGAQKLVYEAQVVCLMIAVLASTFCMVTFLLNKVYTCTALGLWKDVAYNAYMREMVQARLHGFWAMFVGVVALLVSFSLSLFNRFKGKRGYAFVGVSLLAVLWMCGEFADMYNAASHYIYKSYPDVKVLA